MGHPAEQRDVLPFTPRPKTRPEAVLRFPVGQDDTAGGLMPEGVKASLFALDSMQRERDYCASVHAGGAFDAVLSRCRDALAETERLVESLVGRGLRLRATGSTLWVGPRALVTDDVRREVLENRDRLLAYLGGEV
jgi:hypothetical protein